jgi:hypothetical protein
MDISRNKLKVAYLDEEGVETRRIVVPPEHWPERMMLVHEKSVYWKQLSTRISQSAPIRAMSYG